MKRQATAASLPADTPPSTRTSVIRWADAVRASTRTAHKRTVCVRTSTVRRRVPAPRYASCRLARSCEGGIREDGLFGRPPRKHARAPCVAVHAGIASSAVVHGVALHN